MSKLVFPSGAEFDIINPSDIDDGIDYNDPVGNGIVPLIRVSERENEKLSMNFKVKELMANDPQAKYARISPELVESLQKIRTRIGRAITVRNTGDSHGGYRHLVLNKSSGGANSSQHISGRAADLEAGDNNGLTGKDLAQIALEELGCNIGIGIGNVHIHLDVRGHRDSWGYPLSSEIAQKEADELVKSICG